MTLCAEMAHRPEIGVPTLPGTSPCIAARELQIHFRNIHGKDPDSFSVPHIYRFTTHNRCYECDLYDIFTDILKVVYHVCENNLFSCAI